MAWLQLLDFSNICTLERTFCLYNDLTQSELFRPIIQILAMEYCSSLGMTEIRGNRPLGTNDSYRNGDCVAYINDESIATRETAGIVNFLPIFISMPVSIPANTSSLGDILIFSKKGRIDHMGIKMADGTGWAVTAFSTTSFMLGLYNAGLVDPKGLAVVLPVAFFFGGLMQILVAILEIFSGNPFGATVFGSYGPFWVILGAINVWFVHDIPASAMSSALAVFLAMWAIISAYFTIASLPTNRVLSVILALITVALILLSLGAGLPSILLTRVGGWVTLAFATLGWYYAFAHLLQFTYGRNVLPLGVVVRRPDGTN